MEQTAVLGALVKNRLLGALTVLQRCYKVALARSLLDRSKSLLLTLGWWL